MITARISNFKDLERELRAKVKRVPKAAAHEAIDTIADNSDEGNDIEGKKMKPYSKGYASWRKKQGLPTSPVDLRVTGHLLDKRRVRVSGDDKSSIAVSGADAVKAEGIMKKRKFYPETDADATKVLIPRIVRAGEIVMSDREYI